MRLNQEAVQKKQRGALIQEVSQCCREPCTGTVAQVHDQAGGGFVVRQHSSQKQPEDKEHSSRLCCRDGELPERLKRVVALEDQGPLRHAGSAGEADVGQHPHAHRNVGAATLHHTGAAMSGPCSYHNAAACNNDCQKQLWLEALSQHRYRKQRSAERLYGLYHEHDARSIESQCRHGEELTIKIRRPSKLPSAEAHTAFGASEGSFKDVEPRKPRKDLHQEIGQGLWDICQPYARRGIDQRCTKLCQNVLGHGSPDRAGPVPHGGQHENHNSTALRSKDIPECESDYKEGSG
mmetsp:Transcript_107054/g.149292  ORF Transcript_107054/g.149292 Transcript_107054/m.149292 type:complete len:293 (-) Transcript_107054:104-982(-)